MKTVLLSLIAFFLSFTVQSSYAIDIPSTTDARLCVPELSAAEQDRYFSRMVNLGASYSKGCIGCDLNKKNREHLKKIGEFGWVNRNYLVKFFRHSDWKNPEVFHGDFVAVVENDPKHVISKIFDNLSPTRPYRNIWQLPPSNTNLKNMDASQIEEIFASSHFRKDAKLVGGLREDTSQERAPDHYYGGNLYQAYLSDSPSTYKTPKSIFDFAVDGSRSMEIFKFLGDKDLFEDLLSNGWKDEKKRAKIRRIVGERIAATRPTMVISADALFWDSVPRLLARIHNTKGVSLSLKILTSKIVRERLMGQKVYPFSQEERMIGDFLRMLSDLSFGKYGGKKVPVVVARLIHDLAYEFENKTFSRDFAILVSKIVENLLGEDVEKTAIKALRKFKRSDYEDLYRGEKMQEYENGFDPGRPLHTLGPIKFLIKKVIKDLPLIVMALEKSFNETNMIFKNYVASNPTHFKVIDVDNFYRNLPYLISPVTIHPSSYGSLRMANILNKKLCE